MRANWQVLSEYYIGPIRRRGAAPALIGEESTKGISSYTPLFETVRSLEVLRTIKKLQKILSKKIASRSR